MAGKFQFVAVKEEIGIIGGGGDTMSNFLTSLKTTVQNAEGVIREIEEKKKENQMLREKLQIEVMERIRLEKECKELKESVQIEVKERLRLEKECKELKESVQIEVKERLRLEKECKELKGVREELDRLSIRLKENEVDHNRFIELKRRNCQVECEKLRAETELDVYKTRFKELEGRVCRMEKDLEMLERLEKKDVEAVDMEIEKDASAETNAGQNFMKTEILSETDANPTDSSSHKKTEDRVVIIVSDDEAYMSDE